MKTAAEYAKLAEDVVSLGHSGLSNSMSTTEYADACRAEALVWATLAQAAATLEAATKPHTHTPHRIYRGGSETQ